jgi:hypothetical protein
MYLCSQPLLYRTPACTQGEIMARQSNFAHQMRLVTNLRIIPQFHLIFFFKTKV